MSEPSELPFRCVQCGAWENVLVLRISHQSAEKLIHFHQVEIYGCDGINYASAVRGGSAVASSEQGDGETWGPARFVVDGDRERNVCHWRMDGWRCLHALVRLAKPVDVESFAIFNMCDDEYDHRLRCDGHLVELLNDAGEVVFAQHISQELDVALFDQAKGCRQRWINEDARSIMANVSLEVDAEDPGQLKVCATRMSGELLVEVFTSPEATPAMLCEEIGRLCGLEAYHLRLLLADGRVLRLSSAPEPLRSYLENDGAEGLETSEQQSRRLARRTPEHSLEEAEGLGARRARTPPLPKNLSMPNLHERHDTEAAKGYDRQVDRWLRRLMVDVNISHKSLPESSARSQICTHLEKVHGWFDRSKKASTFLKQSAGCEKPPVPSKQVTNYLPMDHPVPPGSMYWERPEKLIPKPKGEEDMEATSANDATTDLESSVDTLLDVLDL
ncbi:Phthiocerol synthesis polyketide synthase type I PpsD [Durusdinium trenchii]|uniref:Phthiocerol synthesis polyketide synthase type I PpsD n=1 Tax=Durusdinium trenchii TaxID=1381693 RepID=A0ABP0M451_9DINO